MDVRFIAYNKDPNNNNSLALFLTPGEKVILFLFVTCSSFLNRDMGSVCSGRSPHVQPESAWVVCLTLGLRCMLSFSKCAWSEEGVGWR